MSKQKTQTTKTAREIISPKLESIILAMIELVEDREAPASARVSAAKELLDRHDGRARQSIEATVKDDSREKYNAIANQLRLEFLSEDGR